MIVDKRDSKGKFKTKYKETNNKKNCSVCNKLLPIQRFPFLNKNNPNSVHKIGLREARCQTCRNSYRKMWRKNPKNQKKEKEYSEKNKERIFKQIKKWKKENRDKINKAANVRAKVRRKTDEAFKLRSNLSRRINHALNNHFKDKKIKKSSPTISLLGCTIKKLIEHLEKQFQKGMNWKNYGKWEIDHIIPCAKFNLENENDQKICFNYTNLQPLWKLENIKKSDKLL